MENQGVSVGNQDWRYYSKEVEVYELVTTDKRILINHGMAELLRKELCNVEHKDKMVFIGDDGVRLFSIRSLLKVKRRFCSLPLELQKSLVEREGVFAGELDEFSEDIKCKLTSGRVLGDGR